MFLPADFDYSLYDYYGSYPEIKEYEDYSPIDATYSDSNLSVEEIIGTDTNEIDPYGYEYYTENDDVIDFGVNDVLETFTQMTSSTTDASSTSSPKPTMSNSLENSLENLQISHTKNFMRGATGASQSSSPATSFAEIPITEKLSTSSSSMMETIQAMFSSTETPVAEGVWPEVTSSGDIGLQTSNNFTVATTTPFPTTILSTDPQLRTTTHRSIYKTLTDAASMNISEYFIENKTLDPASYSPVTPDVNDSFVTPIVLNVTRDMTTFESGQLFGFTCEFPEVHEWRAWANMYGIPAIAVLAVIMNLVSFSVFRSKAFQRKSYAMYFMAIAIVNTLSILSSLPRQWLTQLHSNMALTYPSFYDRHSVACKTITFLSYVSRCLSSWLLVALTVERSFALLNPMKHTLVCDAKNTKKVICYTAIVAMLLNAHIFGTWNSSQISLTGEMACTISLQSELWTVSLTIASIAMITVIPGVAIILMNMTLIKQIVLWGRYHPRMLPERALRRSMEERRGTIMVLAVSSAFCILSIPLIATWVVLFIQHFLDLLGQCQHEEALSMKDVTDVVFMMNYCMLFFLCFLSGQPFRRGLLKPGALPLVSSDFARASARKSAMMARRGKEVKSIHNLGAAPPSSTAKAKTKDMPCQEKKAQQNIYCQPQTLRSINDEDVESALSALEKVNSIYSSPQNVYSDPPSIFGKTSRGFNQMATQSNQPSVGRTAGLKAPEQGSPLSILNSSISKRVQQLMEGNGGRDRGQINPQKMNNWSPASAIRVLPPFNERAVDVQEERAVDVPSSLFDHSMSDVDSLNSYVNVNVNVNGYAAREKTHDYENAEDWVQVNDEGPDYVNVNNWILKTPSRASKPKNMRRISPEARRAQRHGDGLKAYPDTRTEL